MKEKYYENRFNRYFIFGEGNGKFDVSNSTGDVVQGVSKEDAERLISQRDELIDMLIKIGNALEKENDQVFKKLWYG